METGKNKVAVSAEGNEEGAFSPELLKYLKNPSVLETIKSPVLLKTIKRQEEDLWHIIDPNSCISALVGVHETMKKLKEDPQSKTYDAACDAIKNAKGHSLNISNYTRKLPSLKKECLIPDIKKSVKAFRKSPSMQGYNDTILKLFTNVITFPSNDKAFLAWQKKLPDLEKKGALADLDERINYLEKSGSTSFDNAGEKIAIAKDLGIDVTTYEERLSVLQEKHKE